MAKNSYSFKVGKLECLAVKDGVFSIPHNAIFKNASLSEVEELLHKHGLRPGEMPTYLTCLLVKTGKSWVLIDSGFGPDFEPQVGKLAQNIQAAGIKLTDISTIIHSHGHTDHVGGNMDHEGRPVFPNARYFMPKKEFEFWAEEKNLALMKETKFKQAGIRTLKTCVMSVKDRLELIDQDAEILPGIKAIPATGHTPGMIAIEISSNGENLLYTSDVAHYRFQLDRPDWFFGGDILPEQAVETRCTILSKAATDKSVVMAYHFPFPGLGHIKQSGPGSWNWQPI